MYGKLSHSDATKNINNQKKERKNKRGARAKRAARAARILAHYFPVSQKNNAKKEKHKNSRLRQHREPAEENHSFLTSSLRGYSYQTSYKRDLIFRCCLRKTREKSERSSLRDWQGYYFYCMPPMLLSFPRPPNQPTSE